MRKRRNFTIFVEKTNIYMKYRRKTEINGLKQNNPCSEEEESAALFL
jgi:hypothetical protein